MRIFRNKKAKPSFSSGAFRSLEHLASDDASSAPHFVANNNNNNNNNNNIISNSDSSSFHVSTAHEFSPHPHPQFHPHAQSEFPSDSHPPPAHRQPAPTSLHRSHTQRLRTPPEPSTITVVNNNSPTHLAPPQSIDADLSDQSWPSSPTDKAEDQEPRRSKRSLFSFHTSTSSSSVRDQPGLLERNRSVKKTLGSSRRQSQQQQQQHRQSQQPQSQRLSAETWSRDYAVDARDADRQHPSMQQSIIGRAPDPRLAQPIRSTRTSSLPRSNTDPSLFEAVYRQSPVENPRHAAEIAPTPHQLDAPVPRPPSRQSLGPPTPLPPPPIAQHEAPSTSQLSAMSDRPSGGTQQNQAPPAAHASLQQGTNQEAGFRNNAGQQATGPEPGRSTPTSKDSRNRDDVGDIDVRALLQKHEELQNKYSKVKRYYFERDAQVQQLQNTVAHQRMAVSRTVLDDNEYANRFSRLDGAIKDLAFSIRRNWKTLPVWLTGFVNEDAPSKGAKEMTAIGRAVTSRWLVEELFERYFHPVLEPTFSQQLKSIEMNLRRQQTNTCTEEDKENAIARISNWRRTTLDGLTEALHGPAATEYRTQLIDRLVDSLVATLVTNLHDPPPPGLDNGARMIIENAIGIAEKIPLESRDICVDYIRPGTPIHEATMKIEAGVLPPLTTTTTAPGSSSSDPHPNNHPETNPSEDTSGAGVGDRESSSGSAANNPPGLEGGQGQTPGREPRMRSVFHIFMGRKAGQTPPPAGPSSASVGETLQGSSIDERRGGQGGVAGAGRIRFASFVTAEVRGRGPLNVLVKAPVYPID